MKCEISADCRNCNLGEMRDAMIAKWQAFEEEVAANPSVQLTAEGQFLCTQGARKWNLGPVVLGYTCRADSVRPPTIEFIEQDAQ